MQLKNSYLKIKIKWATPQQMAKMNTVLFKTKLSWVIQLLHVTKGTFLWEDLDQNFWSVVFLLSKSFFRSVIYMNQIHSGQGYIGSLIWVICKRIIGSMIWHISLGEGAEINHCAQRFWPWITYVLHIWDPKMKPLVLYHCLRCHYWLF